MADYSDPKQGGDLSDMAATGTTVPNDAGVQNLIPSKPRSDQLADETDPNNLGADDLATAADNPGDIPRSTKDTSVAPDILTGTGDSLPGQTASKRLHPTPGGGPHDPLSKGHPRTEKHAKGVSDFEAGAAASHEVEETASGDKLYEEKIEDEYAKREGGA